MNRQFLGRLPLFAVLIPISAVVVFLVLTWPAWRWLWQEWMGNEYYSHGMLIPLVTVFLAIQRMRNDRSFMWLSDRAHTYGVVVLAASVLLFAYYLSMKAYYLASFAMIGLVSGSIWALGGVLAIQKLVFPILYLVFMIPLPFVERATLPLAMFTGVCSGGLVRFLGMNITIVGNAVTLPNADLVIGAQCSGINSLITLTALTVLAAYLLEGPIWGKLLLVLFSIPLALLGNILRISSLLWVAQQYGVEAAFTFYHNYSGLLFFLLALLLMVPLARILQCHTLRAEVI